MAEKIKQSQRVQAKYEAQKNKHKQKNMDSEFDQLVKEQPLQSSTQMKSPTKNPLSSQETIKEAVKEKHKEMDEKEKKKEESADSEENDTRKQSRVKVGHQRINAKGRTKERHDDSQQNQDQKKHNAMAGGNRRMAKALKKAGVDSLPVNLRGKLIDKLDQPLKIKSMAPAKQSEMIQHILDKIIQFAKVGINHDGDKEIQLELNEKICKGMKLRIISKKGKVHAEFKTDKEDVKQVLHSHNEKLLSRLKRKGIDIDEIIIS